MRLRRVTSLTAAGTLAAAVLLGIGITMAATGPSDPLVAQLARHPLFASPAAPTSSPAAPPSSGVPTPSSGVPTPSSGVPTPSSGVPTPAATQVPTEPTIDFTDDMTLSFRLERVRQALDDLRTSPLIGMGANSYGQRHVHPGTEDQPDYLAVFPVTVLHDAGILGLGGLVVFAALFLRLLLRPAQRRVSAPFLASLTVMVIAYLATDALRFSQNWILMGVALGLALRPEPHQDDAPE